MKLIKRLFSLINFFILLVILALFCLRYVSADGFLGALTPATIGYHLALPLGFIVAWIFIFLDFSKTNGVVILIYGALLWGDFSKTFGGSNYKDATEDAISLISYNTRLMNYYGWSEDSGIRKQMIGAIHQEDPEILCLQEYVEVSDKSEGFSTTDTLRSLFKSYAYQTNYSSNTNNKKQFGLITFSKYPIIDTKKIRFENDPSNSALLTKLQVEEDTLVVVNVHLGSIRFSKIDFADTAEWNEEQAKSKWRKLREATKKREVQVQILLDSMKNVHGNIIVCGDINDTPHSKSYQMLTGSLQDAIIAAKIGVHSTYNQFPFPLRIDYALFGGEIAALSYTDYNWNLSDHEPFKFMFKLNN